MASKIFKNGIFKCQGVRDEKLKYWYQGEFKGVLGNFQVENYEKMCFGPFYSIFNPYRGQRGEGHISRL